MRGPSSQFLCQVSVRDRKSNFLDKTKFFSRSDLLWNEHSAVEGNGMPKESLTFPAVAKGKSFYGVIGCTKPKPSRSEPCLQSCLSFTWNAALLLLPYLCEFWGCKPTKCLSAVGKYGSQDGGKNNWSKNTKYNDITSLSRGVCRSYTRAVTASSTTQRAVRGIVD